MSDLTVPVALHAAVIAGHGDWQTYADTVVTPAATINVDAIVARPTSVVISFVETLTADQERALLDDMTDTYAVPSGAVVAAPQTNAYREARYGGYV